MNAIELVNEHHEPIEWVAEGLLRPGIIGLAGASSAGKSTLLADMSVSVVLGEPLFGHYIVPKPRPVVYCVTEEEKADLARYLDRQFRVRGEALSPDLHIFTDFPPAEAGGLEELEELVLDIEPGLVIIDVFADFQQIPTVYNQARPLIRTWNQRAKTWGTALVGTVHSDRRGIPLTGPWMARMLGSVGAPGAMTIRIGLARFPAQPKSLLRVTGKGTQDHDLELDFDEEAQRFRATDAPPDNNRPDAMSIKRQLIMAVVEAQDPPGIMATAVAAKAREMALLRHAAVDIETLRYDNLRQMMHQMVHNPNIPLERVDGRYFTSEQLAAIKHPAAPDVDASDDAA